MKSHSKPLLVLLLCLTTAVAISQNTSKPRVFSKFPESVDGSYNEFNKAFTAKEGEIITVSFSDNLKITGTVLSNVQKYSNLQSLTIKAPEYANAIFHLSKQINADNTIAFVGRIISTEASDGYEIKNKDGSYTFQKIDATNLRQICNQ